MNPAALAPLIGFILGATVAFNRRLPVGWVLTYGSIMAAVYFAIAFAPMLYGSGAI